MLSAIHHGWLPKHYYISHKSVTLSAEHYPQYCMYKTGKMAYTYLHMQFIATSLPYIQIIISVILIAAILLQARGSSVGGAFGGSDDATFYTRRGSEKALFHLTIVLGALFALSAFVQLFI
jgi:protein translocase SecG subunit